MHQITKRTCLTSVALLIALSLLVTVQLTGSTNDVNGAINGYVYAQDSGGRQIPIRDASVYIVLPETYRNEHVSPPVAQRVTNRDGFYTFLGLLPGRYYVVAQARGYYGHC